MNQSNQGNSDLEGRQNALRAELNQLQDVVGPGPLVDLLLERAFQLKATDIHLDPTSNGLRVRLRVDGLLHDIVKLPPSMTSHVISRVKLMANMNLTERRLAQDGRISGSMADQPRDIRVGSGPTIHGERIVLRLMPQTDGFQELEDLGLEPEQAQVLREQLESPYGMLLSVGPVGSGKSTTMYNCMERLNDPHRCLTTLEDPVERRLENVVQVQTDNKINFGFVEALRGVLRQDPDVLMIGEIRDAETSHIACRAALTGVLVLCTMHANDCASTIDVFREYDVPPMFIADSVRCIITQRLVRRVCTKARELYHPDEATCRILDIDPEDAASVNLARGIPSVENFHTGYSGRVGVFEVMAITKSVREAILKGKSSSEIRELAMQDGMMTLETAGRKKVLAGTTSIEELHRLMLSSTLGENRS
ncbi:GspE/PulE family protein [Thalassoroseus pseudoceratinae]|uniref:GspE/PulE family protein n=1 Tax=Thalassoroseus pseudoceratinae TaxID=2713176 RepID=UPI00141DE5DA|nr:GspE/PulE family protein [Thalassoroseus pseudoceratinae]